MNNDELNKDNFNLSDKEDNFSLPENYFDSFSARLLKKMTSNNELNDYPLLTSLQKKNLFAVPVDYFDLKEDLFQYPLLIENKIEAFITPHLYFDVLSDKTNNVISLEEEKEVYSVLYSYKRINTFSTPVNYFEELSITFPSKNTIGWVVPLYQRIKLPYKVAATITLLISLSMLFYINQTKSIVVTDCNTFACLDKKDILNSSYVLHASDDNIIDLIDEKSLSDSLFLKKNGKTQKVDINAISDNVDINTLTDNL